MTTLARWASGTVLLALLAAAPESSGNAATPGPTVPVTWEELKEAASRLPDDSLVEMVRLRGIDFEMGLGHIRLLRQKRLSHATIRRLLDEIRVRRDAKDKAKGPTFLFIPENDGMKMPPDSQTAEEPCASPGLDGTAPPRAAPAEAAPEAAPGPSPVNDYGSDYSFIPIGKTYEPSSPVEIGPRPETGAQPAAARAGTGPATQSGPAASPGGAAGEGTGPSRDVGLPSPLMSGPLDSTPTDAPPGTKPVATEDPFRLIPEPDAGTRRTGTALDPAQCESPWRQALSGAFNPLEAIASQLDLARRPSIADGAPPLAPRMAAATGLAREGFPEASCLLLQSLAASSTPDADYACVLLLMWEVRDQATCPLPDLPSLAARDTSALPPNVAPLHAYMVARDLFESGDGTPEGISDLLNRVPANSPPFGRAVFLQALLDVRNAHYPRAVKAFLNTSTLQDQDVDGVTIGDLSQMNLGRIAGANGLHDIAAYHLAQVPPTSRAWLQATYERVWEFVQSGNNAGALGTILALEGWRRTPRYHFWDLALVAAAILDGYCHGDEALRVVQKGQQQARSVRERLAVFEETLGSVGPYCDGFCRSDLATRVPPENLLRVAPVTLEDAEVRRTALSLQRTRRELDILGRAGAEYAGLADLVVQLQQSEKRIRGDLALFALRAIGRQLRELDETLIRFKELEVDYVARQIQADQDRVREIVETEGGSFRRRFLEEACVRARQATPLENMVEFVNCRRSRETA